MPGIETTSDYSVKGLRNPQIFTMALIGPSLHVLFHCPVIIRQQKVFPEFRFVSGNSIVLNQKMLIVWLANYQLNIDMVPMNFRFHQHFLHDITDHFLKVVNSLLEHQLLADEKDKHPWPGDWCAMITPESVAGWAKENII